MPSRFFIDRASRLWPRSGWLATELGKRVMLGVAVILLAAVPLSVRIVPLGLEEGKPAPRTFRAPRSIQYVDQEATDALKQTAAAAIAPVYVFDQQAQAEARRGIVEFFSAAASARTTYSEDTTAQAAFLTDQFGSRFDTATIEAVVALPSASLDTVARNVETLVGGILSARLMEDDLATARTQLAASAELMPLTLQERLAVISVGNAFIEPTLVVDEAATERTRQQAMERVAPVVIAVQEGENIVERGDIVTARDIDLVRSLGGLDQGIGTASVIAGIVLMSLLILAAGAYLAAHEPRVWARLRDLTLLATLLLGMMYTTRLVSLLAPEVSPYVMPVPLAAILATLLVGARPALVLATLTAVAGLLLGYSGGAHVVAALLSGLAAIAMVAGLSSRTHLFYAGGVVALVLGVVSFGASLASGNPVNQSVVSGAFGLGGGVITAILTLGLLPFFELAFGVTTDITLLEIGSPSHPLLRRLMTEAPGTYSHSVMAANLAETAAEAIGANPLLARAGAYFHDVGKIRRPAFFVENQAGSENPHDSTTPAISARIITAHVRDGVELARQYRLPQEVVDIIRQHHGTSVVTYFFDKAAKRGGPLLEADFRYDGERPTSREAALVMIADAAEAAVRTVSNPSEASIAATLDRIVRAKADDNQFDRADVTFADLRTIVSVYSKMLASIYHPRVEYPEPAEVEARYAGQSRESQGA